MNSITKRPYPSFVLKVLYLLIASGNKVNPQYRKATFQTQNYLKNKSCKHVSVTLYDSVRPIYRRLFKYLLFPQNTVCKVSY